MTHRDDSRLLGRHPEFCRMSLRPGIGADMMHDVASELLHFSDVLLNAQPDVPSGLRVGSKVLPLGRYLRKRLRVLVGRDDKAPQEAKDQYFLELLPLLEAAKSDSENISLRSQILAKHRQQVLNSKSKSRLFTQRRKKL